MDFVFYDLETTGISPAYDQPLQFAAILTNEHFVEKQRVNIRCRLAPHILPSPQALIVTGCPSSDNLGQLSVLSFGGSGSPLIEVMAARFVDDPEERPRSRLRN